MYFRSPLGGKIQYLSAKQPILQTNTLSAEFTSGIKRGITVPTKEKIDSKDT